MTGNEKNNEVTVDVFESYQKTLDRKTKRRRKSWASKLKRRISNHVDIEEIRKEVFKPFCAMHTFNYQTYKKEHRTMKNPLIEWKRGTICFSEKGVREPLQQNGADLSEFNYSSKHVTESGMTTLVKPVQPSKASSLILVVPSGMIPTPSLISYFAIS